MKISKYLSYREVIKSYIAVKKGISNIPSDHQLKNIINWARGIFDPVRSFIDTSLGCSSIYRSPKLNIAIGGSSTSQHCANNGAAGDIDADIYGGTTNEIIFNYIKNHLDYDQMILEGLQCGRIQWIHCSYINPEQNRNEILLMYVENNKTYYENYTENKLNELIIKFKK